jgi:hypothetical protein
LRDFIDGHPEVYVVEQNRDGQLKMLLQLETGFPVAPGCDSVALLRRHAAVEPARARRRNAPRARRHDLGNPGSEESATLHGGI